MLFRSLLQCCGMPLQHLGLLERPILAHMLELLSMMLVCLKQVTLQLLPLQQVSVPHAAQPACMEGAKIGRALQHLHAVLLLHVITRVCHLCIGLLAPEALQGCLLCL